MFKTLIRWFLRRPEPKKQSPMSLCPECGEHIFYHNGHTKATHFHEHHPEYKFRVERAPESGDLKYSCLVCNKTFGNFKNLVEKHKHMNHKADTIEGGESARNF